MYPDGAGLYLQVTGEGAKSWILRYSLRGKAREMGLGSFRKVSLADARRKAAECRVSRASPVQTACATVREMKEGPSRPEVRFWSQATASCCRQERWW